MELSEVPATGDLSDADMARLAAALAPMARGGRDLTAAAAEVRATLAEVIRLEREVRAAVDEATATSKEVVEQTLPPYWPYLLGATIVLALSGFLVMEAPGIRLPYIAGVALLLLGLLVHFATRLYRRSKVLGPLQNRFEEREGRARELFHAVAPLEERLRDQGFALVTDTYVPFGPAVETLAAGGPEAEDLARKLAQFVTGDDSRPPPEAATDPGPG